MTQLTYEHDCDRCTYFGSTIVEGTLTEWYVCNQSVIGRFGSDGPEYWSAPVHMLREVSDAGSPFARNAIEVLEGWL